MEGGAMDMKYQSQNNEAELIIQYFNGFVGNLLDVGANDGRTFSNSYDLIQLGWSAHLVEPGKSYGQLQELYKDSPNVKTHNIAIGNHTGIVDFHDASDSLLSSLDVRNDGWKSVKTEKGFAHVSQFNLFWDNIERPKFDFITLDAEMMDWDILQQINLYDVGCKCLCIEYWKYAKEITDYCVEYGMKVLAKNFENMIFVK